MWHPLFIGKARRYCLTRAKVYISNRQTAALIEAPARKLNWNENGSFVFFKKQESEISQNFVKQKCPFLRKTKFFVNMLVFNIFSWKCCRKYVHEHVITLTFYTFMLMHYFHAHVHVYVRVHAQVKKTWVLSIGPSALQPKNNSNRRRVRGANLCTFPIVPEHYPLTVQYVLSGNGNILKVVSNEK